MGTECLYGGAADVLTAVGHFPIANDIAEELSCSFDALVSRFLVTIEDTIVCGAGKWEVCSRSRLDEAVDEILLHSNLVRVV